MNPTTQILSLARLAAPLRLRELADERTAILAAFPDLDPTPDRVPGIAPRSHHAPRPRKGWTKARRAAQSQRIRKIWKQKRKAGLVKPATKTVKPAEK